jgi:DNA mismatch endonuclease (patch repair protein)
MPDNLSPEDRRKTMRAVKGTDTSLERVVYAAFAARGWDCGRNVADLPGKPDFVFAAARLVVFVDGDFWHGWRFPRWREKLTPYWKRKIERTRRRDRLNYRRLRRLGWRVLRLWGHQVEKDLAAAVGRVAALLADSPSLPPRFGGVGRGVRGKGQAGALHPLTPGPSPPKRGRGESASGLIPLPACANPPPCTPAPGTEGRADEKTDADGRNSARPVRRRRAGG